jgi:uncharacterized protein YbjT (DUF2867 family)
MIRPDMAILVTGATGLTGSEVVRQLAARGIPVRALARNIATTNAAKAAALGKLPGVELVEGDMARPESLGPALAGIDRAMLISASAADMAEVQRSFVDAAAAAGVPYVVKLSGIMPEIDSPFRYARMHGEVERHIERSGMAWTHLRAGEFMHAYFRQVPSIVNRRVLALPMADGRIASIDIGDIARVAVDVLAGTGHEGRIYSITGPESLTMAEVAGKLSAATGNEIRYVAVAPDEARAAQLANGMPEYTADGLYELFAERRKGKEATVWPTISEVFGWQPLSFDAFARRHAAIFRGEAPAPKV